MSSSADTSRIVGSTLSSTYPSNFSKALSLGAAAGAVNAASPRPSAASESEAYSRFSVPLRTPSCSRVIETLRTRALGTPFSSAERNAPMVWNSDMTFTCTCCTFSGTVESVVVAGMAPPCGTFASALTTAPSFNAS